MGAETFTHRIPETITKLGPFRVEEIGGRTKLTGPHGHYRWLERPTPFDCHRALLDDYESWWSHLRMPRVYFVASDLKVGAPIKAGIAGNPRERLRALQTSHPTTLQLFALEYGGREREAELHQRWKRQRMNGEWFKISPPILEHVAKLADTLETRLTEVDSMPVGRNMYLEDFAARKGLSWEGGGR
ncbi:GIY-YIG nuclease family protein [Caulobacter segnis]